MSKRTGLLFLLSIIGIAIFFRSYQIVEHFEFAHDGDLYSWIVKDIVVNHHLRLIGQLTSTEGIFIGPLFYYFLIPFYLLSSMNPLGVLLFAVLVGIVIVLSYYFVFSKLFGAPAGLIAAFLQASLFSRVATDRWVVPTITSNLWGVWYLYTVLMLARGNFVVFPLLGLLVGLIWHINFSLAPVLLVAPVAVIASRKLPKCSDVIKAVGMFILPMLPFVLFEFKHGFIQTNSFIKSFIINQGGGSGIDKFNHVFQQVVGNTVSLFFYPQREIFIAGNFFFYIILGLGLILVLKKKIEKKLLLILYLWIFSVVLFFSISSKITSEYYFSIIDTAVLAIIIISLAALYRFSKIGIAIVIVILLCIILQSLLILFTDKGYSRRGYLERKAVAEYIAKDAKNKDYPCISISYIASLGEDFGFRYMYYLNKLNLSKQGEDIPNYTIIPSTDRNDIPEVIDKSFGAIGVVYPKKDYDLIKTSKSCSSEDQNMIEPLFGYTQ